MNGAMVAPQQPPPILPATTESASANDAPSLTTAGTTPSPAVQTPTTPTSTYKEYQDGYIVLMMRLAAMTPAHQ